tara:strand:+ start:7049 stop:8071 length:1023 start_codon:yes stop_codon:yes gene_type:complete
MTKNCIEYIWIDANNQLRGKTKIIDYNVDFVNDLPNWNFDGSSTGQSQGNDSEVILKPRALFKDPFRGNSNHKLVLCDTYTHDDVPLSNNHRNWANNLFCNKKIEEKPWFGLEQEYFMIDPITKLPLGFNPDNNQGQYYCSVGNNNAFGRQIAEEHLHACLHANIKISGINAEVAPGQWEFQIGPCIGIEQGDHLWMARYLLLRIGEMFHVNIDFNPKPLKGRWNGSGCHANYSTENMRNGSEDKTGLEYIHEAIAKLSKKHNEHMLVYGDGNNERMTGLHETASYDTFTHGIADRNCSIRIGNENMKNQKGYFEDRRPSSNCDPYLVTGIIFQTTCLDN